MREDLPDETVAEIRRAVVARRDSILLQDRTPLPLDQIGADHSGTAVAPAERFWAENGYQ